MKHSRIGLVLAAGVVLVGAEVALAEVISESGDCHKSVRFHQAVTVKAGLTADSITLNGTNVNATGLAAATAPGYIVVGNASSNATAVAMSGGASITTNGTVTIVVVPIAAMTNAWGNNFTLLDTNATTTVTTHAPLFKGRLLFGNTGATACVWRAAGATTNDWTLMGTLPAF